LLAATKENRTSRHPLSLSTNIQETDDEASRRQSQLRSAPLKILANSQSSSNQPDRTRNPPPRQRKRERASRPDHHSFSVPPLTPSTPVTSPRSPQPLSKGPVFRLPPEGVTPAWGHLVLARAASLGTLATLGERVIQTRGDPKPATLILIARAAHQATRLTPSTGRVTSLTPTSTPSLAR
jgi:hypothetical protein